MLASGPAPRHVGGMSVSQQAAKLREDFAFLGAGDNQWEARFAHLIDLGKALPQLAPHEYVAANKVRGCASQVWLVAEPSPVKPGAIRFRGTSDAMIVSGLIAMLLQLFSDQRPADILAFDADAFFREIGVADALTPQRSNGLKSMLARIRAIAEASR
jgi:cysteine desulfuration protein SufE